MKYPLIYSEVGEIFHHEHDEMGPYEKVHSAGYHVVPHSVSLGNRNPLETPGGYSNQPTGSRIRTAP